MAQTTIEPSSRPGEEPDKDQPAPTAPATPPRERTFWRAIVRTGGQVAASRERDRVEWHLADCAAPRGEGQHCNEGQHLIETVGQPDGHCMVKGRCGRCGETARTRK